MLSSVPHTSAVVPLNYPLSRPVYVAVGEGESSTSVNLRVLLFLLAFLSVGDRLYYASLGRKSLL